MESIVLLGLKLFNSKCLGMPYVWDWADWNQLHLVKFCQGSKILMHSTGHEESQQVAQNEVTNWLKNWKKYTCFHILGWINPVILCDATYHTKLSCPAYIQTGRVTFLQGKVQRCVIYWHFIAEIIRTPHFSTKLILNGI